ncbi:DnaB-like helicase C-terminal domain-containing protein [Longivirga aurantiaca]|uniref:DnaB-like helicase C-terminal domain-containing protein n=1 Tax=Longivirga aurantiaca TaxID=1837743 RepID=A0ABW1T250_9ACTN
MTADTPQFSRLARLSDVLDETDARLRRGEAATQAPWSTGFMPLDSYLSGGLRPGELILLGGPQGMGKTTFALQIARQAIAGGHAVLYVSYEHDSVNLLERLVAAEAGERAGVDAVPLRSVRALLEGDGTSMSLSDKLAETPGGAEALAAVSVGLDRLHVLRGGVDTSVTDIEAAVREVARTGGLRPLVVVDYVQKIAMEGERAVDEERRMAHVAGGLKDLALTESVPVLAISASDAAGISEGKRLRTQNLRGASSLAYEADVVLVLNEKYDVVARHHLVYGAANVERFHQFAVLTIEKNRGGMAGVDLEFRKRFEQARYERAGELVTEQLVDARLFVE